MTKKGYGIYLGGVSHISSKEFYGIYIPEGVNECIITDNTVLCDICKKNPMNNMIMRSDPLFDRAFEKAYKGKNTEIREKYQVFVGICDECKAALRGEAES